MDPQILAIAMPITLFLIGACIGSFLNVVVYRLPLGLSLVTPPSACPKCNHKLAAYDNVPILGWIWLGGKCRYCREPISVRYPLVELATAVLFVGYYLLVFQYGYGPYEISTSRDIINVAQVQITTAVIPKDWALLAMNLFLIGVLLAASLIDLDHFIIPIEMCWLAGGVGIVAHAFFIKPGQLGSLEVEAPMAAATVGAVVGLVLSLLLVKFKIIKRSFEDDAPLLEVEKKAMQEHEILEYEKLDPWKPARIRAEIMREVLFLMVPITVALVAVALVLRFESIGTTWARFADDPRVNQALASIFGGLVGGGVVWFFRIGGSLAFGREAMGLGDVHLMLGVGAVIGAMGATAAFFIAPAFGLLIAILVLITKGRREIPYGPYLSLATLAVMIFYTPIVNYVQPGLTALGWAVQSIFTGGGEI